MLLKAENVEKSWLLAQAWQLITKETFFFFFFSWKRKKKGLTNLCKLVVTVICKASITHLCGGSGKHNEATPLH